MMKTLTAGVASAALLLGACTPSSKTYQDHPMFKGSNLSTCEKISKKTYTLNDVIISQSSDSGLKTDSYSSIRIAIGMYPNGKQPLKDEFKTVVEEYFFREYANKTADMLTRTFQHREGERGYTKIRDSPLSPGKKRESLVNWYNWGHEKQFKTKQDLIRGMKRSVGIFMYRKIFPEGSTQGREVMYQVVKNHDKKNPSIKEVLSNHSQYKHIMSVLDTENIKDEMNKALDLTNTRKMIDNATIHFQRDFVTDNIPLVFSKELFDSVTKGKPYISGRFKITGTIGCEPTSKLYAANNRIGEERYDPKSSIKMSQEDARLSLINDAVSAASGEDQLSNIMFGISDEMPSRQNLSLFFKISSIQKTEDAKLARWGDPFSSRGVDQYISKQRRRFLP